jgi:hypothetical protein
MPLLKELRIQRVTISINISPPDGVKKGFGVNEAD